MKSLIVAISFVLLLVGYSSGGGGGSSQSAVGPSPIVASGFEMLTFTATHRMIDYDSGTYDGVTTYVEFTNNSDGALEAYTMSFRIGLCGGSTTGAGVSDFGSVNNSFMVESGDYIEHGTFTTTLSQNINGVTKPCNLEPGSYPVAFYIENRDGTYALEEEILFTVY